MILEMGAHCIVDDHSGTCEDISLLTAPDGKPIQAFMLTVPYNRVSNYEHRINYIGEMLEKFSR